MAVCGLCNEHVDLCWQGVRDGSALQVATPTCELTPETTARAVLTDQEQCYSLLCIILRQMCRFERETLPLLQQADVSCVSCSSR